MSVDSLRLVAARIHLTAPGDAQPAEAIRPCLALAEVRATLKGFRQSAETYRADLVGLWTDVERLGAECRLLEKIMSRASGAKDR